MSVHFVSRRDFADSLFEYAVIHSGLHDRDTAQEYIEDQAYKAGTRTVVRVVSGQIRATTSLLHSCS